MFTWSPMIFSLVMLAVCTMALVRGRWEEKLLGGAYLAACMLSLAVERRPWSGPQGAIIAIDALVLLIAIAVAINSAKVWPILAAAFQVLTVGAHLAFLAAPGRLGPVGYLTALAVWSYGMVACLSWSLWPCPIAMARWIGLSSPGGAKGASSAPHAVL